MGVKRGRLPSKPGRASQGLYEQSADILRRSSAGHPLPYVLLLKKAVDEPIAPTWWNVPSKSRPTSGQLVFASVLVRAPLFLAPLV